MSSSLRTISSAGPPQNGHGFKSGSALTGKPRIRGRLFGTSGVLIREGRELSPRCRLDRTGELSGDSRILVALPTCGRLAGSAFRLSFSDRQNCDYSGKGESCHAPDFNAGPEAIGRLFFACLPLVL